MVNGSRIDTNRESPGGIESLGIAVDGQGEEISLLDLLLVLARHWRLIVLGSGVSTLLAIVLALHLPNRYTATAVIMPPQKSQSGAAALLAGQLGALGGVGAGGSMAEVLLGLLQAHEVENTLIQRFHLMKQYRVKTWEDAQKILEMKLVATVDKKSTLIKLTYTDNYPIQAAQISNAAVAALEHLLSHLAVTKASQKRVFFEHQVQETQAQLNRDESDLNRIGARAGWIEVYPMAGEVAASNANIRAEIASREVELSALGLSETPNNPDYLRVQQRISSLKAKLMSQPTLDQPKNLKALSPEGTAYLQKYRDVAFEQEVLKLMEQQYETAKVDEAKDYPEIQIIDLAVVPEKPSGPKRLLIAVGGAFVGLFFFVVLAFIIDSMRHAAEDPEAAEKIRQIKNSFWS